MRDEASAVWKKMETGIKGGAQRLGSFVSKNWASTGLAVAGAFYVVMNALDKVDKIAKKVAQSLKDAGGGSAAAQETAKQLLLVGSYAEKAQKLFDELVVRGSLFAVGAGNAVATFFATLFTLILTPLARIEEGLNAIGISNSKTLQGLRDEGVKHIKEYSKAATDAFSAALAASKDLGVGLEDTFESWEKGQKIAEAVKTAMQSQSSAPISIPIQVIPKMAPEAFNKAMAETNAIQEQRDNEMSELINEIYLRSLKTRKEQEFAVIDEWAMISIAKAQGDAELIAEINRIAAEEKKVLEDQARDEKSQKDIEAAQKTARMVGQLASQALAVIGGFQRNASQAEIGRIEERRDSELQAIDEKLASEELSEEQRNLLLDKRKALENQFQNQIRAAKQRQFEAEKTAAVIQSIIQTAVAVVEALPNIPLAIAVGVLGAAQTAVIAGQPTPKFHQGGVVPGPEGREVVSILQAGETVRTPEQERGLQGGGITIIQNFNGPTTRDVADMAKKGVEEVLRRTGLPIDKAFVRNQESLTFS